MCRVRFMTHDSLEYVKTLIVQIQKYNSCQYENMHSSFYRTFYRNVCLSMLMKQSLRMAQGADWLQSSDFAAVRCRQVQ